MGRRRDLCFYRSAESGALMKTPTPSWLLTSTCPVKRGASYVPPNCPSKWRSEIVNWTQHLNDRYCARLRSGIQDAVKTAQERGEDERHSDQRIGYVLKAVMQAAKRAGSLEHSDYQSLRDYRAFMDTYAGCLNEDGTVSLELAAHFKLTERCW